MNELQRAPRILVLTFTPIAREPRALKQIHLFSGDFDVTSAGYGPSPAPDVVHFELDPAPKARMAAFQNLLYKAFFVLRLHPLLFFVTPRDKAAYRQLRRQEWDVIIAHDVLTVPLASRLSSRRGLLIDLHEYAARQGEESASWRRFVAPYFRWILRRKVARAAAVTTVSQGIVDAYQREFGVRADLVMNSTPYYDLAPTSVSTPIRLVHSGSAAPARKIEVLIEAMERTRANVTLDLYLVDDGSEYLSQLRGQAAGNGRVRFHDAVPYSELVSVLNQYDLGISLLAPINFNHVWALPNKFFDYLQARLGVIIGPSPEMTRIVSEHGFGLVTEGFEAADVCAVLDSLTPDTVGELKMRAHSAASTLDASGQIEVWDRIVKGMLDSPLHDELREQ